MHDDGLMDRVEKQVLKKRHCCIRSKQISHLDFLLLFWFLKELICK